MFRGKVREHPEDIQTPYQYTPDEGGHRCPRCRYKKTVSRWRMAEGAIFFCSLCRLNWRQVYTNLKTNMLRR